MTWHSILKADKALVGRNAKNPNLFLQRNGTKRNIGTVFTEKDKPSIIKVIPLEVPKEEFTRYRNFLSAFFRNGGWKKYIVGSVQEGITNNSVEIVLRDFERGKFGESKEKYSDELDATAEKLFEDMIKRLKTVGEMLQDYSRTHIRHGRNMIRFAEKLEQGYDLGRGKK